MLLPYKAYTYTHLAECVKFLATDSKIWSDFGIQPPLNESVGGYSPFSALVLMRLIDHYMYNGPRWAFGTHVIKKTCTLILSDVPLLRSIPSLGQVLHENQSNFHFDPQLLGSWNIMTFLRATLSIRVWSSQIGNMLT